MKIFKFKNKQMALNKQRVIKRQYGYNPSIIRVRTPKTRSLRYVVVKPTGLKRI